MLAFCQESKYPKRTHQERLAFLHQPQLEALETYIYLKKYLENKPTYQAMRSLFLVTVN